MQNIKIICTVVIEFFSYTQNTYGLQFKEMCARTHTHTHKGNLLSLSHKGNLL